MGYQLHARTHDAINDRTLWRYLVAKAVQFLTLLLFSLVTGVFWGTWFSLSRSMAAITPGTFLEVGRLMIAIDIQLTQHLAMIGRDEDRCLIEQI